MPRLLLAAASAAVAAICASPATASALDLELGVAGRVGIATLYPPTDNLGESRSGFGGGGRVWLTIVPFEAIDLGVGLNVDISGSRHVDETSAGDEILTLFLPSVGGMIRAGFGDLVALDFWLNYAYGSYFDDIVFGTVEGSIHGLRLGADVFLSFEVAEDVAVEFGPYFTWADVTIPPNVFGDDATFVTYGINLQTTFGLEL